MLMMIVLVVFYIIPIIIVPINFNNLFPTLFELSGFVFPQRGELSISYLIISILGLIFTIFCLKMYSVKLSEYSIIFNKIILISISVIINILIVKPSIKIFFYENYYKNLNIIEMIDNIGSFILKISIITLIFVLYLFVKDGIPFLEYRYEIKRIFNVKK